MSDQRNDTVLRHYSNTNDSEICDPFDTKSADFNAELYLNKLLKESSLSELMEKEQTFYKQIQSLDSEMQTLVYENYNKFISATETIRKMSSHFDKMEQELDLLTSNMDDITTASEDISQNLRGRRQHLSKLSTTHTVLAKLQFLFELSPKMRSCIEQNAYSDAVKYYTRAESTLSQYSHFPSISAINQECIAIHEQLKQKLYLQLSDQQASPNQLNESIELLLKLKEPPKNLCREYLLMAKKRLESNLSELDYQNDLAKKHNTSASNEITLMDILEYIDMACNGFLNNLMQTIHFYTDIFLRKDKEHENNQIKCSLKDFVELLMNDFFEKIGIRIQLDNKMLSDATLFVRALDRFYKRLQSVNRVYSLSDFSSKCMHIIENASENQCKYFLSFIKLKYVEELTNIRHSIASSTSQSNQSSRNSLSGSLFISDGKYNLTDLLITLQTTISELIKSAVAGLTPFTDPEVSFTVKTQFLQNFKTNTVREGVVIGFIRFILSNALEYDSNFSSTSPPSQLILLLSRLCLDLDNSIIGYLLSFIDEQFNIDSHTVTPLAEIRIEAKNAAQKLLNYFVRLEGQNISQMIRKSVETRDWLSSVEPRSVRSVMKRVIEDIAEIDTQVGQLYEEGTRLERSSDSSRSRRTFSAIGLGGRHSMNKSSNWSAYGPSSTFDNSLMSNIQKLFTEKIEIFGSVEFSKLSVVTGIIKIGLKTLIECVRLCTFSRYGLQQMQVDSYYLQTHVWPFVSDENLVYVLIDEVLLSTIHRCFDPIMMEMSVVEKICEGF